MNENGSISSKDETEEFLSGFKTVGEYVQSGFGLLIAASRGSNTLLSGTALLGLEDPSSDYRKACVSLRHNAQEVFKGLLGKVDSKKMDKDFANIPDLNDRLLDSIGEDLMILENGPAAVLEKSVVVNKPSNALFKQPSWNSSPVVCALQLGRTSLLAAKNVERPQLSFKDKVDNSTKTLWSPRITDKPNNLKPLAVLPIYNDAGDIVDYTHPYEVEIDAFSPCAAWLKKDLGLLPLRKVEDVKCTLVETTDQLEELLNHLRTVKEMAVDLEHHSYRTYQGITCLLQISTEEGGDFIVDTLTLREHLHRLNETFTNPKILKVFHGADMDVVWLQRDLGVYVVGMMDTHQAATLLQLTGRSLAALTQRYCGSDMDKKYQLADWRIRPLPQQLLDYARGDTHSLLYVWRRMREDLLEAGQGRTNLLEAAFTASKAVCLKTYQKPVSSEDGHMDLYIRSKKHFNSRQLSALKGLYHWRDGAARLEDESTAYVLPNHMLLHIAETLPREMQGLLACCNPVPPLVKRNLQAIYQLVYKARTTALAESDEQINLVVVPPPTPSILKFVHDKLEDDFKEGLPVYLSGGGPIRRQKKKHNRKPWSLESPPVISKEMDLSSIKIRFVSPYQRCLMVKDYKESI